MENEILSATVAATEAVAEAAPTALDNALTIGIVAAMAIAVIIMVIRKLIAQKQPAPVETSVVEAPTETVVADAPTAPGTAGEVKLNNVDPKTAAILMAIVADKLQKPINELRFLSIKEVSK